MAENEEGNKRKSDEELDVSEIAPKRARLDVQDLKDLSKEDILERVKELVDYVDELEKKQNGEQASKLAGLLETGEKLKQQQQESTRRENVLVMRLATKEQEMQDLLTQIHDLKQAQNPSSIQLRSTLLDPAVNLLFQRMKTDLDSEKEKLEQAQNDLNAWKFTPDSVTGKKLMAKCRMLIQENQELGSKLSQGRVAQLEAELALQKKYSDELKGSQDELNDFVIQLDEEVEGMQSTILTLQHQLKDCKQLLSQSQENVKAYEDKLKTSEKLLAEMRQQNSPVSVKLEDQDEHVQAQAQTQGQTQSSQAHSWTDSAECATGDTTSPVAAKSEESKESEERILLSASVTVPAMKPASVPSAFSISQLLATDSNPGKENKTEHAQDNLENGGSNHESSPSEPIDMGESPLVAAMGVVERIGSEPNTFNGEVTG
ncbi:pre-mRNA-splicing regulator WTAP-like isoform X2 [Pocillopora damicornis]|uniref:pre-mRNA-splicing regulator WTAP-like isoform X2 n=1 Tax=Pocillopora damicornis TaxID=46731 RepID=UPI000F54EE36|nr:pre-mRNA-splicing regulator WTAP-like isoform X2 [Pocillopora damicornis]